VDEDWLRELEETLLKPETRRDVEALSKLLADDFHEKGASGQVYDRAEVLSALPSEPPFENYVISDFIVTELDTYVAMLNYRLETSSYGDTSPRLTLRTSMWRLADQGWQMFFHQGTPVVE
jgi:hypothetical protein